MGGSFARSLGKKWREWLWPFLAHRDSDDTARRIGDRMSRALMKRQMPEDPSPEVQSYLAEMGDYLASHLKRRSWRFSIKAARSPLLNALALPGGYILVTRSLLEFCQWEQDQVAFVLAHEMGHVVRRHIKERMKHDVASSLLLRMLGTCGVLNVMYRRLAKDLLTSGYSQETELDADALGVNLIMSGGFRPEGAIEFLESLGKQAEGSRHLPECLELFSSHPKISMRIENIEREIEARRRRSRERKRRSDGQ